MAIRPAVRRLIPWGLFAAVLGATGLFWYGPPTRGTEDKPAVSRAGAPVDTTSLLVDFKDDVSDEALAHNGFVEEPVSAYSAKDRLYRINFSSVAEAQAAAAQLARDPDVESVDPDVQATLPPDELTVSGGASLEAECSSAGAAKPSDDPNDPCFHYQWHLRQIGLPGAWKLGQGKGVVVAVIDTGVTRVADLAQTPFVPGYNFIANNDNAADDHGHGTHVAGTIAESTNNKLGVAGVAYGVSIMPIKVLSAQGSGSMGGIAQGIRWAADHGANVINMSLGGPLPVGTIASAVNYAREKGVTIVAAAGNNGHGRVSYPARYPGVIAVAATQFDETTTFYSNWGPQIDIAAPGGNVRVDQNGDGQPDGVLQHTIVPGNISKTDYLWFMGTSMASPHVAGVAALIVGAGVRTPDAVEQVLLDTARKPKAAGAIIEAGNKTKSSRIDDHYGAGVADAGAALRKARGGRGASELGIGAALALLGASLVRRRGRSFERLGLGFIAALIAGSSGLFVLPLILPSAVPFANPALSFITTGFPTAVAGAIGGAAYGNPLLWSAAVPLALTALLYGVRRLRPALAGFGYGVAGALLFAAIAGIVDVRFVPDVLDRAWLVAQAGLAALLATAVLVRK